MKINVNLYGGKGIFGGKEKPLSADIIECDKSETCSFYKSGKCLRCRSFLAPTCRFGSCNTIEGYTSRARKYYDFKRLYEQDPVYNKLQYPTELLGLLDEDTLFMNPKFISVKRGLCDYSWYINGFTISDPGFGTHEIFLSLKSDVTTELLNGIFSYVPHGWSGGVITDYQEKVVPDILLTMSRVLPDLYKKLITDYPKYDKTPSYIGKTVFINSLKPGTEFVVKNTKWVYDGEYVTALNVDIGLTSPWWSEHSSRSDIKLRVNDEMTTRVTNNSMVDSNTRFA